MTDNQTQNIGINSFSELAKWGTLFIATVTFATLSADWVYTLNYFKVLGAPSLVTVEYLSNPIHTSGVLTIFVAVMLIGSYSIFSAIAFNALLKPLFKHAPRKYHVPVLTLVIILVLLVGYSENYNDASLTEEILAVVPLLPVAPIAVIVWLFSDKFVIDISIRSGIKIAIIFISTIIFAKFFVVDFSSTAGKTSANEILQGVRVLPVIALVTEEPLLLSDEISVEQLPSGKWVYYPKLIDHPVTKNKIFTLQLLGSDDDNILVLDIWGSSVHSIPKVNIAEIVHYNFSENSMIASGVNQPDFLVTVTP